MRRPRLLRRTTSRLARPAAAIMAPVLKRQGRHAVSLAGKLPEASGPRTGRCGSGPGLSLVVIGESTAAGVGVEQMRDSFGVQVAGLLAEHLGRSVHWHIAAKGGATASHVLRALIPTVGPADVAVIALGVNDVVRMRSGQRWRSDMMAVVTTIRQRLQPGGLIVLCGVPQVGSFPALRAPLRQIGALRAQRLDDILRTEFAGLPGVRYLPTPTVGPSGFAADGFHPNAASYRLWAEHIDRIVTAALQY